MSVNPQTCRRVALYEGRDGFNRLRHASIPVPDDMTLEPKITRMGVVMKLISVTGIELQEVDYWQEGGAICRPQSP